MGDSFCRPSASYLGYEQPLENSVYEGYGFPGLKPRLKLLLELELGSQARGTSWNFSHVASGIYLEIQAKKANSCFEKRDLNSQTMYMGFLHETLPHI